MKSPAETRHEDLLYAPLPEPHEQHPVNDPPKPPNLVDEVNDLAKRLATIADMADKINTRKNKEAIPFIRYLISEGFIHIAHHSKQGYNCYACANLAHWRLAPEMY